MDPLALVVGLLERTQDADGLVLGLLPLVLLGAALLGRRSK